jgi:hypothetical protein
LFVGDAFQLDVQLGCPLALEFLAARSKRRSVIRKVARASTRLSTQVTMVTGGMEAANSERETFRWVI